MLIDFAFAVIIVIAIIKGYQKGLINAVFSIIAFAVIFFAVVILVRLGGKLIEKAFQVVMLGWLNRIGGIIFYAALYIIILSIFIFYAEKLQLLQPAAIESSQTYNFIQPWGPKVMDSIGRLIPAFKDMFTELGDFFNSLSNKISH